MKTMEPIPDLPADLAADTQAILDKLMTGKVVDPEVARRIRERGDRIREAILQKHGVLDIGVPAIRELRDG
ncbi:MAG: hypothetical protein K2R98_02305 [Gemmataceae bacterium]|nr:hypothetical protein [Gemmataceae bacterium]